MVAAVLSACPTDWCVSLFGWLWLIIQTVVFGMVAVTLAEPTEKPEPLTKARKWFPNNPGVHCLYRWVSKGVRGVVLESVIIGGRVHTTREAVATFLLKLNAPRHPCGPSDSERAAADARRDAAYERRAEAETKAALASF